MAEGIPLPNLIYKMPIAGTIMDPEQLSVAFEPIDRFFGRLAWIRRYLTLVFASFAAAILFGLFIWWSFTGFRSDILTLSWINTLLGAAIMLLFGSSFCLSLPQILMVSGYLPESFKAIELKTFRDLLTKFYNAEIAVTEYDETPIDSLVFSTFWALALFSRYETHRCFRLPHAERIYSAPIIVWINRQAPALPPSPAITKMTTNILNVSAVQNISSVTNNHSVMQVMFPSSTSPNDPIPKTVGGEIRWYLYSIWNLPPTKVEKIFDSATIYPSFEVKALRAKIAVLAIAERVTLVRVIEQQIAEGNESRKAELGNLKSRSRMISHIRAKRKMSERELISKWGLSELEAREFARLNQQESTGRDSKLQSLISGSYKSVNPAMEKQARNLKLIKTRYLQK